MIGALIDKLIIDLTKRTMTLSIIVIFSWTVRFTSRRVWPCCIAEISSNTVECLSTCKESKNPVVVQFLSGSTEGPILGRSNIACSPRRIRPDKAPREIPLSIATDYLARCFLEDKKRGVFSNSCEALFAW